MRRILLHVCCAPCSTSPHRRLETEGWETVLFFYNPNLHPREEHDKRLAEAKRYAGEMGLDLLAPEADFEGWAEAVRGMEEEPEGGRRCETCFSFRLDRAARAASECGCNSFTTTLSVSPHKRFAQIERVGSAAGNRHGIAYLSFDFKKKDGFQESVRLSEKHGLYRQDYCGCRYSRRPYPKSQIENPKSPR